MIVVGKLFNMKNTFLEIKKTCEKQKRIIPIFTYKFWKILKNMLTINKIQNYHKSNKEEKKIIGKKVN